MLRLCALTVSCALAFPLHLSSTPDTSFLFLPDEGVGPTVLFLPTALISEIGKEPSSSPIPVLPEKGSHVGARKWVYPIIGGVTAGAVAALVVPCSKGNEDFCSMGKGVAGVLAIFPGLLIGHVVEKVTR